MKLSVVFDTSGSMSEGGKYFAALTTLKTLEQFLWMNQSEIEVDLYAVNDGIEQVPWDDFSLIGTELKGSFNLKVFLDSPACKTTDRLLILSDCCWSSNDKRAFKRLGISKGKNFARVMIAGAEADRGCRSPEFEPADHLLGQLEGWLLC